MRPIHRIRELSAAERRALWPAFWRLLLVRICLLAGIRRSLRLLDGARSKQRSLAADELPAWKHRALALRRSARLLPGTHCLARALALRWWMRAGGLDARLQIGVAGGADSIESHAWVTLAGHAIDDTAENLARFRPLADESAYRPRP